MGSFWCSLASYFSSNHLNCVIFISGNARRNITAYWIGASDIDTEGIWKWEGPDVELMYKDPNFQENTSPNNDEDCIALNGYDDFNWHDGVCYERVGYPICEIM